MICIIRQINIPPSAVKVNSVPRVLCGSVCFAVAVYDIARDALTSAVCGEKMGKVIAHTFFRLQGVCTVEILIDGIVGVIVFNVLYNPFVARLYGFFIRGAILGKIIKDIFVSKTPRGRKTIRESALLFVDENV